MCLCHLDFGHLVIVSDLVLRYSDFHSAKNAEVLAPLRGFPHTTSYEAVSQLEKTINTIEDLFVTG